MAIRPVSRRLFDSHRPTRGPLSPLVADEQEWFVNDEQSLLGILIRDKVDDDWGYVILGRDQRKRFRAIDAGVSFKKRETAREKLVRAMSDFAQSGVTVFPQETIE